MLSLTSVLLSAEYLYRVLKFNNCSIPDEVNEKQEGEKLTEAERQRKQPHLSLSQGLYMIRYHSFYPWHSHGDYTHLCNHKDQQMLPWVQEFKSVFVLLRNAPLLTSCRLINQVNQEPRRSPPVTFSVLAAVSLIFTRRPRRCPTWRS